MRTWLLRQRCRAPASRQGGWSFNCLSFIVPARSLIMIALAAILPVSAQVCDPRALEGPYAFQLSGTTTISGSSKPVAGLGLLEFDGEGGISGTASVNFAGLYLGSPVKGEYEAHANCTVTWSLRDDSGAFQHFTGVFTPDLQRATFRQTDPGGARNGTLARMAAACSTADLQGSYRFTISRSTIPMQPGDIASTISLSGTLTVDAAGNLTIPRDGAAIPAGTAEVDSDCEVHIVLLPSPSTELTLLGALTGQREILAIQTDPGASVNATFRPR